MKLVKLAAIDIGSNSVRLLITNVIPDGEETHYKKSSMTRLPVRLGADAFINGKISKKNFKRMVDGMIAYQHIMKVHGVTDYRACATSAMREAGNGESLVKKIYEETGIRIEIIDGKEEARLIFASKLFDKIHPDEKHFLYIDVGGGSTELTVYTEGTVRQSRSFKVGTVRILNGIDKQEEWDEMKRWIEEHTVRYPNIAMIGSGGNINKLHKLSGKPTSEPLSLEYLEGQKTYLSGFTHDELVTKIGLNLDRADVIIPAIRIYHSAMAWANSEKMYVPKIGVADGVIRDLYHHRYRDMMENIQPSKSK